MIPSTTTIAAVMAAAPLARAAQLVWPSKWDEMEDLMTMQGGYEKRGFLDGEYTVALNPDMFHCSL
jgi:hypothetical protein